MLFSLSLVRAMPRFPQLMCSCGDNYLGCAIYALLPAICDLHQPSLLPLSLLSFSKPFLHPLRKFFSHRPYFSPSTSINIHETYY